jgi:hypothetical protein
MDSLPSAKRPPSDAEVEPRFVELRAICPSCGEERGYTPRQVSRQLRSVQ